MSVDAGAEARAASSKERKARLPVVYWIMVVLVLVLTFAASLLIVRMLFRFHVLEAPGPVLLLGVFVFFSLIVGALFSQVFVRSITRPILEMSDAARKIAAGDYDITLKEKTFAEEIQQMEDDFTSMARELASTEMLRSDFVTNVSHEMKTPLAAIKGYATLQLDPKTTPEQSRAYAQKVLTSTQRLSKLSDDVLLLSQLENEDKDVERETFSLSEQLREAVLLYEPQWSDGKRALGVDFPDDDVYYDGNADLLFHVWQNIIGNAFKFTKEGDEIAVHLHRDEENGEIVVSVEDGGIGMSEEECRRAFEKFYQADRSRATEGNGLGLTLAKRIVELHGGRIWAESEPGEGTTVTVALPA